MIPVQLKAKEFYLIAYLLLSDESSQTFNLLNRIREAIIGAAAEDDDLVVVNVTKEEVINAYRKLTFAPEGIFNDANTSMYNQLSSQIATGVLNNEQEWVALGETLSGIRTENLNRANDFIAVAKTKLS